MRTVLFVANYPSNTGFAWTHIETLFANVANTLHQAGTRTFVAYPRIDEPPRTLLGSRAVAVELDATLDGWGSLVETFQFVRREGVDVLYLTDQRLRDWKYALLRMAGVRRLIVHDRVSGEGTPPRGHKRLVKELVHRTPLVTPDCYVAVSDFVKRRLVEVGRIPYGKITRIHNGFAVVDPSSPRPSPSVREMLEIDDGAPLIACACRASPEKGVMHLFRAFDGLWASGRVDPRTVLVYVGDGPQFDELETLRRGLPSRDRIFMPGYVPDAVPRLNSADLFAVPSVWHDAFPSAVLEPMAWGKPVVASAVGGIPEMVEEGVTGFLVPPGDEEALASAIETLLNDPRQAERFGREGRFRVERDFNIHDQVGAVADLVMAS